MMYRRMLRAFVEGQHWRHPLRAWRIFLSETARKSRGYKQAWEYIGRDPGWTYTMMNGSPDEATLQRTGAEMAQRLRDALAIEPEHRVLEIGCGVARVGRELAPAVEEWHGVDISSSILRIARRRTAQLGNVRLHELSRPALPFAAATFDRIYSHLVLFHLAKEDMFLYLREAARTLRPGGLIYFDTWNLQHPEGWARFEWEIDHHADKPTKPAHRNRFCTPGEVRLYLEQAGLTPLAVLDESFWVQVIAARPGAGIDLAELTSRLRNLPALVPHGKWYY